MATIVPQGELAKRALAWLSEQLAATGGAPLDKEAQDRLMDEAAMRFNLGPLDVEFLRRTLASPEEQTEAPDD